MCQKPNLINFIFNNISPNFLPFQPFSVLMAPQNSTLIQQIDQMSYNNDDISSTATSEKITSGTCMQDLVSNYSPILRPKSAGDRHYRHSRYVENVPTTTVAGIYIPPSNQKKSIVAKNTIKNGKTYDNEEVCTIHNHFSCLTHICIQLLLEYFFCLYFNLYMYYYEKILNQRLKPI